jgi:hypothetical protein
MHYSRHPFASLVLAALVLASWSTSRAQPAAEVIVLSTLHQFHETNKGYSFADLSRTIERIKPDVLAVELTPDALKNRTEQKTKREYPNSVFLLIDKHGYTAIPLEPDEPEYSRLIGILKESNAEIGKNAPQKAEAFNVYSKQLYEYLFAKWTDAAAVNSPATDAMFEVKHKFQNALFGEKEETVWNSWNSHFLKQVLTAASKHPGRRVLVLVGVEHAYWLRDRLRKSNGVRYSDVLQFLK